MLARIREVLVISTPEDTPRIQTLLGDGSQFGMKLEYVVRRNRRGWPRPLQSGGRLSGMSISAPEEIAYMYEWIGKDQLAESVKKYGNSPYGKRLKAVLEDKVIF